MKKLFLTSVASRTLDLLLPMIEKDPSELKVAFIPTAGNTYKEKPWMEEDRKKLVDLGFDVTDFDLKGKTEGQVREALSKVDIIFVAGGNTFYLLDKVKKSGFDKAVKNLVNNGKIYIGSSAGSYIACPTIEAATWKHADKNIVGLKNLTGLNLVPFIITAHFNREKYYEAVKRNIKKTRLPVVALYDTQAIIVEGNKYRIVGEGPKEFFNGFEEKI
jgi:dipeptidase E